MATEITCKLECGHSIQWGENPETPGADLPWVGRVAWCPECESDREIVECDPDVVDIRTITEVA